MSNKIIYKVADKLCQHTIINNQDHRHLKVCSLIASRNSFIRNVARHIKYLYAFSWHYCHNNEEKNGKHFYCNVCRDPELFDLENIIYLEILCIFHWLNFALHIRRATFHFYHKFLLGLPHHNKCRKCNIWNGKSIKELQEMRVLRDE